MSNVIDLVERRALMQRSCGHSIMHRSHSGRLTCSWCGLELDDAEHGEPA